MMMMLATFSSAGEETPTAAATAAGSWLLCPKLFFPYALPLASAGVGGYTWRFPKMGLPPNNHPFLDGFSMKSTIQLLGYPHCITHHII